MQQQVVESGDARIATEAFGNPSDPPILLIMGAMASMLWWPDGLVEGFARSGRYVIRYDNRDTGLSTTYPRGEAHYTTADMANDALAVMDGYRLGAVHLVGMSAGGMIAQRLALGQPDRFASLTLISTTPVGASDDLPSVTKEYAEHAGRPVDWSDRASILDFMIRDARMLASTRHPHDAAAARRLIERDLARSPSFASATNHFSIADGDEAGTLRASDIAVPTLVIHGTSDPIFPIAHGEALAAAVPGSKLARIEGGGHELHQRDWPQMIEAIAGHTGSV